MKNKRYLRYLNRYQRDVYQYHCWPTTYESYEEVFDWCEQMFGSRHKRWQAKYFSHDTGDPFAYKTLYMFRNHSDAVLFNLRWNS